MILPAPLWNSEHIQDLFNYRAPRWTQTDFLVREIAQRLAEPLDIIRLTPQRILDAGCAQGADLKPLSARYPEAQIIGVDFCSQMLQVAQKTHQSKGLQRLFGKNNKISTVQGNISQLPFAPNTLDLIWSNLALHYLSDVEKTFAAWHQALKVDGVVLFSTFGQDTLKELFFADQKIGAFPSIQFADMHDLGDLLVENGFSDPVMHMEKLTLTYSSPHALLKDAYLFGLSPLKQSFQLSKQYVKALCQALEDACPEKPLKLSIEIIYGHAWKISPTQDKEGNSIIRFHQTK